MIALTTIKNRDKIKLLMAFDPASPDISETLKNSLLLIVILRYDFSTRITLNYRDQTQNRKDENQIYDNEKYSHKGYLSDWYGITSCPCCYTAWKAGYCQANWRDADKFQIKSLKRARTTEHYQIVQTTVWCMSAE